MKKFAPLFLVFLCSSSTRVEASLAIRLSQVEIISAAKHVVAVRCLGQVRTFTSDDGKRIFTEYAFEVEESFRGSLPRFFTLIQPGGRLGRLFQKVWGYPTFSAGESLLLFLTGDMTSLHLVGLSQGVFVWQDENRQVLRQRTEGLKLIPGSHEEITLSRKELIDSLRTFPFRPAQEHP